MNASPAKPVKRPFGAVRPFPWRCRHCGHLDVDMGSVPYDAEVRHDGRIHAFTIPTLVAPVCRACNEMVVTGEVDKQITVALRAHLHLLTPEEIAASLTRVGLGHDEAAKRLGIATETLSAWLDETQIQSRAMDNLLRVFFGFPEVRKALAGQSQDPLLGIADMKADFAPSEIAPSQA